jgi:hypothetical protein
VSYGVIVSLRIASPGVGYGDGESAGDVQRHGVVLEGWPVFGATSKFRPISSLTSARS